MNYLAEVASRSMAASLAKPSESRLFLTKFSFFNSGRSMSLEEATELPVSFSDGNAYGYVS